ncbi:DUF975 family protein [Konateibacter massiliensis]|uniref:DUF975 family protein n=1 Tax=Konateibacter massiliensis TaxID=2002841 RepID=UPI000C15C90A|nr:DUF975 family protein [Konateibacter massiliensis]
MWNRAGLKANAKENLKRFYWPAFLVCLIVGMFTNGGGGGSVANGLQGVFMLGTDYDSYYDDSFYDDSSYYYGDTSSDVFSSVESLIVMLGVMTIVFAIVFVIALIVKLLIGNPLLVGKNRYFMSNRDVKSSIGEIGFAYSSGHFGNVVKTMFLMDLYVFLWSLLLIIPGIIKSYEYAMVPYLMAENPAMESSRAFEISREIMRGEKWNYFVLQLSFIGWFLLGSMLCLIGVVFVNPYYEATLAEFYGWGREKAMGAGISNSYELIGFGENK